MKIYKKLGFAIAVFALLLQTPMILTAAKPTPVTIVSTFNSCTEDFSICTGTFVTTGALGTSGTVTMLSDFLFNAKGKLVRAHCLYTYVFSNGSTLSAREECHFSTDPSEGRWEITGGTGAYANLKGEGSALMPNDATEEWEGVIQ